jgi:hypothetical protein
MKRESLGPNIRSVSHGDVYVYVYVYTCTGIG